MKTSIWNIQVNETDYQIELAKNKIRINNENPISIRQLPRKSHFFETEYTLVVADKTATLHASNFGRVTLVLDGKDCLTGNDYVEMKVPVWGWIFIVLHCINFFLVLGGAIGAVVQLFLASLTANISADRSKKAGIRVLLCIALYVLATAFEVVLILGLSGLL